MGAENSILNNVEWGGKYTDTNLEWTIENGELENGIEISLFTVDKNENKHRDLLRKFAKVIKWSRNYIADGVAHINCQLINRYEKKMSIGMPSRV